MVAIALTAADDQAIRTEVDILHTESETFEKPHTRAVEQRDYESGRAFEFAQGSSNFVTIEHEGQASRG